jgi:hypothetical protein
LSRKIATETAHSVPPAPLVPGCVTNNGFRSIILPRSSWVISDACFYIDMSYPMGRT